MAFLSHPFAPLPGGRAPARPLFAVGDVHGHVGPFEALLERLAALIEERYGAEPVDVVLCGDFVDRGPQPRETMLRAAAGIDAPSASTIALMGNHDRFLIDAAGIGGRTQSATDRAIWLRNGGRETLEGLGISRLADATPERLRDALGDRLIDWLQTLRLSWRSGGVFCAHAGVDPDTPLDRQPESALLWIREPFLSAAGGPLGAWPHDVTVVHGHTVGSHGVFANRIGVDTGGYATGVFTAAEICAEGVRLHHVTDGR